MRQTVRRAMRRPIRRKSTPVTDGRTWLSFRLVVLLRGQLSNSAPNLSRALRAYRRMDLSHSSCSRPTRPVAKPVIWLSAAQIDEAVAATARVSLSSSWAPALECTDTPSPSTWPTGRYAFGAAHSQRPRSKRQPGSTTKVCHWPRSASSSIEMPVSCSVPCAEWALPSGTATGGNGIDSAGCVSASRRDPRIIHLSRFISLQNTEANAESNTAAVSQIPITTDRAIRPVRRTPEVRLAAIIAATNAASATGAPTTRPAGISKAASPPPRLMTRRGSLLASTASDLRCRTLPV
jgi:hypothetical protein